ncbi:MAG: hypothetical protein JNK74_11930 [Candidatus Hydrogenedentes bacterium]|nr:hypothetical protein [Candidatus Hydrogenedentota bacterium]
MRDPGCSNEALATPVLRGWLRGAGVVLLCVTGGLALVGMPLETTTPALDPSWVEAYLHFTKTGAQAGVDYVFTYGPLAHFIAPVYDPDLYALDIAVAVMMAIMLIVPFAWAAIRRQNLVTTLCLLWLVFILVPRSMGNEVGTCVAIITITILLLEDSRKSSAVYALLGASFAFLSLLKFSMTVMCCASMGALILQWFLPENRSGRPVWIGALLGAYGIAFLFFWILAGQEMRNIPAYLIASVEVSRAYVMGMHTPMDSRHFAFGVALGLLLTAQIAFLAIRGKDALPNRRAVLLFAGLALLLAWKMGVARAQPPKFYVPAAAVSVLLCSTLPSTPLRRGLRLSAPLMALTLATLGILSIYERTLREHIEWSFFGACKTVYGLATPGARREDYDRIRDSYRKAFAQPKLQALVGRDTVDIIPPIQSFVFFNDLNYHPRPVFQGYQACSPRLARLNGDFYDSAEAPTYVLRLPVLSAIDGRFPMSEDAEVLKALYRNYRPILRDRDVLVLKRVPDAQPGDSDGEVARQTGLGRIGAWIPLENPGPNWQLLSLFLKPSVAGRLRTLVYQPPMPLIEIRHNDGAVETWRINIGSMESGFIINPVFEPITAVEEWPGASASRRVEAIRVTVAGKRDWVLQPDFEYSVVTVPPLARPVD